MNNKSEERSHKQIMKCVKELSEGYDTVQIFLTRHVDINKNIEDLLIKKTSPKKEPNSPNSTKFLPGNSDTFGCTAKYNIKEGNNIALLIASTVLYSSPKYCAAKCTNKMNILIEIPLF